MDTSSYSERTYRHNVAGAGLTSFCVRLGESDLYISAEGDLSEIARQLLLQQRFLIEEYARGRPSFYTSLIPLAEMASIPPPEIVCRMLAASKAAGVGPMAAVAGAIAEMVGRELLSLSNNLIIENGGDIFLALRDREARVAVFAGTSPLSNRVRLLIRPDEQPRAVCTSSGTVGPSLSFGKADAVCILSRSGALADAVATAVGNRIQHSADIRRGIDEARGIAGVDGVLVIMGDTLGAWGSVEIDET